MPGATANTQSDSGMLNAVVWIEELGSDCTDLWALRLLNQSGQPLCVNNLGIVIQEK